MAEPSKGASDSALYVAKDIVREYQMGPRTLRVVDGASLSIRAGEVLAIVGRSGAGKSTFLHILGLLDRPTTGSLLFRGEDLSRLSARAACAMRCRSFGFVFQFYHLLPEFDALANVAMPAMVATGVLGWWRTRRAVRDRAAELLTKVGLGARLEHKPGQLSGGERQRVAIARALMNSPAVVFCDEPTGNLDRGTAGTVEALLLELARTMNQAFVIVTHDDALGAKADRQLHMLDGRLDA